MRNLFFIAVISVVFFSGCAQQHARSGESGDGGKIMAGAYYYPWYREPGAWHLENRRKRPSDCWQRVMRQHLVPEKHEPMAGHYLSEDPEVIAEHIAQSVRGNISFWAVSWWGINSFSDRVFKNKILKHPDADKLKYAVFYESTRQLGSFDDPDYSKLLGDFKYFEEAYFHAPDYLKVNDRPVVFIYLAREYFRDQGHKELLELRIQNPDIYIVADDVYGPNYVSEYAIPFDAVTAYDVYGQSIAIDGSSREAVTRLSQVADNAKKAANLAGCAFVPAVAPSYNDTAVRQGHPPRARYFTDEPNSKHGDLFRAMIREAAVPYVDPMADNMMMVTSFNEWFEDTQIEATAGTAVTTTKDDSASGAFYTGGDRYHDYGYLYLDILAEESSVRN